MEALLSKVPAALSAFQAPPPWHAVNWPPSRGHPRVQSGRGPGGVARRGGAARAAPTCRHAVGPQPASTPAAREPTHALAGTRPHPQPREERRVPPPPRSPRAASPVLARVSGAAGESGPAEGSPAGSAPSYRAPHFPPQPAWTARREGSGPWAPREVFQENWIRA